MAEQTYHVPSVILLAISIIIAVGGQYLFKAGAVKFAESGNPIWMMMFNPTIFFGMTAYLISAVIYIIALKHIPLSIAYPSLAVGYIAVVLISHFFLGETITIFKALGITFISIGVALLWK